MAGFQLRGQEFPRNSREGCDCVTGVEQAFTVSAARGALLTSQGNFQSCPAPAPFFSVPGTVNGDKKSQGIVNIIKATELHTLKWRILCWVN